MCSASLKRGYILGRPVNYIDRSWGLTKRLSWRGFASELALYKCTGLLKDLQGDIAPTIIAVTIDGISCSLAMEPPHHSFWIEASPDMPIVLKERVIAAFQKLHDRGLLHGDAELRHMLIGGDARVTLIDFQESRTTRPLADLQLKEARRFDFEEIEKMNREYRRDNANFARHMRRKERWLNGNIGPPVSDDEEPEGEDRVVPPVDIKTWEAQWGRASNSIPHRFIVPGQEPEELDAAVNDFIATVTRLEVARLAREEAKEILQARQRGEPMDIDPAPRSTPNPRKRHRSSSPESSKSSTPVKRRRANSDATLLSALDEELCVLQIGIANPFDSLSRSFSELAPGTNLLPAASSSDSALQPPKVKDFAFPPAPPPLAENPYARTTSSKFEISSDADLLPACIKQDPPGDVKVHDFGNEPYDGPRGYYVPHPPTENRMGIERVLYIRTSNCRVATEAKLDYHWNDLHFTPPPNFKRLLPRGRHVSLGALKRARDAMEDPETHQKPEWKQKREKREESGELEFLQSVEHLDVKGGGVILSPDEVAARRAAARPATPVRRLRRAGPSGYTRLKSALREKPQVKPLPLEAIYWADEADLCISPKLGPPPMPVTKNEPRAILGAWVTDRITATEARADNVEDEPSTAAYVSPESLDGTPRRPSRPRHPSRRSGHRPRPPAQPAQPPRSDNPYGPDRAYAFRPDVPDLFPKPPGYDEAEEERKALARIRASQYRPRPWWLPGVGSSSGFFQHLFGWLRR